MGLMDGIRKLLSGWFGSGKSGVSPREHEADTREELFAQVNAFYEAWQGAVEAYRNAMEEGKPPHVLEEYYRRIKQRERQFENKQTVLRDVSDIEYMRERKDALRERVLRLKGELPEGEITGKQEYAAAQALREKVDQEGMEDELRKDMMREDAERHRPPEEIGKDDDFGLGDRTKSGKRVPE